MRPGQVIIAKNKNGTILIQAGNGIDRKYTYRSVSWPVKMILRDLRWYGGLGIVSDEGFWGNTEEHGGINRAVTEEGQQHFGTLEDALEWLNKPWHRGAFDIVYNNEGLVVGWCLIPVRRQINVDVWQIYINGRKPKELPGAQDKRIKILG